MYARTKARTKIQLALVARPNGIAIRPADGDATLALGSFRRPTIEPARGNAANRRTHALMHKAPKPGGGEERDPPASTTALAIQGQPKTAPSHQSRRSMRRRNKPAQKANSPAPSVRAI